VAATLNGMGRPKKSEPTDQLRIPRSVVRRIRRAALHFGMDPGDYVAQRLAAILDKDDERILKDLEKERAGSTDEDKKRR
jgi:hypothetical protein